MNISFRAATGHRPVAAFYIRRLIVALAVLCCVLGVAACGMSSETKDRTANAACGLFAPAIRIIAVATKIVPTPPSEIASAGLDVLGIASAAACAEFYAQIKSDTEPRTPDSVTGSEAPAYVPVAWRLPVNSVVCGGERQGAYTTAISGAVEAYYDAAGTHHPRTSCEFAEVVRDEYLASGAVSSDPTSGPQPQTIVAYSPVMFRNYEMSCSGDYPVKCTGGDGAVVYLR